MTTNLDPATLRAIEDAWWAGRRSVLAQRGEATGPMAQAMCNNDLVPILSKLALAADYVPVEDRERALAKAKSAGIMRRSRASDSQEWAEARRLLKLDDQGKA